MIDRVPMLRVGMTHNGIEVTQKYLEWLFGQLENLCQRGQLWGYNQAPNAQDAPDLMRSRLSHNIKRVHLMPGSMWVDVSPMPTQPGRDLLLYPRESLGAHLRALGIPTGKFKIIGIDVYPMSEKASAEWVDHISKTLEEEKRAEA
jgi:hypothetical protein